MNINLWIMRNTLCILPNKKDLTDLSASYVSLNYTCDLYCLLAEMHVDVTLIYRSYFISILQSIKYHVSLRWKTDTLTSQ
jgi:hypothetical protein